MCRSAAGVCDVAESCPGSGPACPADTFKSSATVCRSSAGVCDVAERCPGNAAGCPTDLFQQGTTVCRSASNACDAAETCAGNSATCPTDSSQPDGTPCDDGFFCTDNDNCQSGVCTGTFKNCDDQNACTTDGCFLGVCSHVCKPPNSLCGTCDTGVCSPVNGSCGCTTVAICPPSQWTALTSTVFPATPWVQTFSFSGTGGAPILWTAYADPYSKYRILRLDSTPTEYPVAVLGGWNGDYWTLGAYSDLVANDATDIGPREIFTLKEEGNGYVSFRAPNGHYVVPGLVESIPFPLLLVSAATAVPERLFQVHCEP
jgi:hypothetical protein